MMVCYDGMKTMTYRTTFALDGSTERRLKQLAAYWDVSQAEVVRRAVELVEKQTRATEGAGSLLRQLHETGDLLAREAAEEYLAEVREDRESWRDAE